MKTNENIEAYVIEAAYACMDHKINTFLNGIRNKTKEKKRLPRIRKY